MLRSLQLPWIALADWNMAPEDIRKQGFVSKVDGVLLSASNTRVTCTASCKSAGTERDFALASASFVPYVIDLVAVTGVPWKTHCGLLLRFRGQ
eukprot:4772211-Pyramimonas_sp.AAC.1